MKHLGISACLILYGDLTYEKVDTNEFFEFPENITESEIEKLMQKSVKDKHDYIFDIVNNTNSNIKKVVFTEKNSLN